MNKFTGVDKLTRKFKSLPGHVVAKMEKALEQGASEIVTMAKHLCPEESGALKRSIKAVKGPYKADNANVRGVAATSGADGITIVAGDRHAWYAALVEFGTAPHVIAPKAPQGRLRIHGELLPPGHPVGHPGAKPNPFFYPAYRALKKRVKSRITRAVKAAAKEAAGR